MNTSMVKHISVGVTAAGIALIISMIASGWFHGADRAMLRQYYRLRGEQQIDSSVIILYFGNNDINALGGLPLKRSYYALLVSALQDVGAGAIGFDISFTEPDKEHPEYDNVFSSVVKSSGRVALGGYFSTMENENGDSEVAKSESQSGQGSETSIFPYGKDFEFPFTELRSNAAGIGHTNISEALNIPLFIRTQESSIPALSLEALRIALNANREDITVDGKIINVMVKGKSLTIPVNEQGESAVNFSGGTNSLRMIPVLRFLQEYDAWKTNSGASAHPFKDKIVLLGIIAEGKSLFVQSPFDSQFPSVGIHAMMIENILNERILRYSSPLLAWVLASGMSMLVIGILLMRREAIALTVVVALLLITMFISYVLFASFSYVLPISVSLFSAVVTVTGILIHKHYLVQSKLFLVEIEKEKAERLLREKESHLTILEKKLQSNSRDESGQPGEALLKEIKQYKNEIQALKNQIDDFKPAETQSVDRQAASSEFEGIVYNPSGPMAEVINFIKKIAATDASILVLGESGTGKELVARAIHSASNRRDKPFVAVNCGALTETLLESELFGHEKGAFTGAVKEKAGRFELANEGTMFLDEIAETSEAFQVKLLRVLQEGTFERVGGTETRKVNIRIIAATNRDIKKEVKEKRFREDVYYRLNVFTILLPPLKDRKGDIELLAARFINTGQSGIRLSSTVLQALLLHEWKGNVRELQSVIKHAMVMAQAEGRTLIRTKDLPQEFAMAVSSNIDIEEQILESLRAKQFARSAITETADEVGGLNRGTVAEYFRGYCFKIFEESSWDIARTIEVITGTNDEAMKEKVYKKLQEYLNNAVEFVDSQKTIEEILALSKPKYKNLPQRYHQNLDSVIKSNAGGKWSLPDRG